MRLATFNLMHGRSPRDGRVEVGRFLDAVAAVDADVLALQEVDRGQPRSHREDLAGRAADVMGARHRFVPTLYGTPGFGWTAVPSRDSRDGAGDAGPPGPQYGIALLSRLPVRAWWTGRLTASPMPSPLLLPGREGRLRLMRDEPRAVLAARIQTPAGPLTVATTHLSFVPGWNALQLATVAGRLATLPGPHLLAGDLNLPGPVPGLVPGWRRLARLATYPAGRARVQFDHVLGHGDLPAVRGVRTVAAEVSDHLALVVEFDIPSGNAANAARGVRSVR
ncbi:MAG TPA: endonuclease/exonuclease/phosphatase family protein [Mycobacteriales bacterium]|nr:endonuclease/exonuclease/phosphatase family protein [Mycobacteriales bacterium]